MERKEKISNFSINLHIVHHYGFINTGPGKNYYIIFDSSSY